MSKNKKSEKVLLIDDIKKRKPLPPEPPKDREVHLFGFSRHKRG
jgi:hypothetical protein